MTDGLWETLLDQIEHLIEEERFAELKILLEESHPADIAMIFPRLSRLEQHFVFDLIDPEKASEILVEVNEPTQERLLGKLNEQRLSSLVDELESDEAADVLASVEPEVAEKVLDNLPDDVRQDVEHLLSYDKDTAGGIMSAELVSVNENWTVQQAIEEIRKQAEEVEEVYSVWVVDDAGVLKGQVPLKNLILAKPSTKISNVIDDNIHPVTAAMDQEEVAHMMRRYDLITTPVVDAQGRLIGRITWDDAMEVLSEESEEDLSYISGTGEEEPSARSVFTSIKHRLPWLVVSLIGEFLVAVVMSRFVESLETLIALAFFIPIINALGGNAGMQSSVIIVRGLATGEVTFTDTGIRVVKELGVALLNGIFLGLLLFVIVIFWQKMWFEAAIISGSLLIVILISSVNGVVIPLLLKKLGADPAVAMGPFVTVSNDIVGVFIYLSIASAMLA